MTVKAHPTYTVTCDRCGHSEELDWSPVDNPDKDWEFWARQGGEGTYATRQRMLCPQCSDKIRLFLDADLTPVSMTFNQAEDFRYEQTTGQRAGTPPPPWWPVVEPSVLTGVAKGGPWG